MCENTTTRTPSAVDTRLVEVRHGVLARNDELARELRNRFAEAGLCVVDLVSSPGSGKTTLLRRTLEALRPEHRVAALVGDLATDRDARTLAESGAHAVQITTGTLCHLDAQMIARALEGWILDALDFLFVENVGNLVCPACYDLGENLRVVLVSVTEGEDKPLKYPTIFHNADLVVITKTDLAEATGFDREAALGAIARIRPDLEVIEVSARTGRGMDAWLRRLARARDEARGHRARYERDSPFEPSQTGHHDHEHEPAALPIGAASG